MRSVAISQRGLLSQTVHSEEDLTAAPAESCVHVNGKTEWFPVNSGVKQGCVAAPELFNCAAEHPTHAMLDFKPRIPDWKKPRDTLCTCWLDIITRTSKPVI